MSRLIDAHDFWARLPRNAENITLADVIEALGSTPTVDAVEVVMCKECKYNTLGGEKGNSLCELEMPLFQNDDFCSRGERK